MVELDALDVKGAQRLGYAGVMGIANEPELWDVTKRAEVADGRVFKVWRDDVRTPDGDIMVRTYLRHPGAVAILAMDDDEFVVTLRQYRHPARMTLIEPPAGLMDHPGEDPLAAAKRELAEEAGLAADEWHVLVDFHATPGASGETIRVFLARRLHEITTDFVREHEEAHMSVFRVPFGDVVAGIAAGEITSPTLVTGALAYAAYGQDVTRLRSADVPWPSFAAKENDDVARP